MEKKLYRIKVISLQKVVLLFFTSLLLLCCGTSEELVVIEEDNFITKESNVCTLIKKVVKKNSQGEKCSNYKYPINFLIKEYGEDNYKSSKVFSDEDINHLFANLTASDKLKIDFPISLIDADDEEVVMSSIEQLEETLNLTLDACMGNTTTYDYCDTNNKKVYMCHNGKTICVSINAIQAHLNHGDTLGQCD